METDQFRTSRFKLLAGSYRLAGGTVLGPQLYLNASYLKFSFVASLTQAYFMYATQLHWKREPRPGTGNDVREYLTYSIPGCRGGNQKYWDPRLLREQFQLHSSIKPRHAHRDAGTSHIAHCVRKTDFHLGNSSLHRDSTFDAITG